MNNIFRKGIFQAAIILLFSFAIEAQQLSTPRVSPQSEVMQQIGMSKIIINYSRPAVNGREIWGKLVPYGLQVSQFGNGNPSPWRAGANENTTISFSDDVKINGVSLKEGTYGLHLIVNENEDWEFIFSKDSKAWGNFFYNEKNDALRVKVKPIPSEFIEWLQYSFDDITPNSVKTNLMWDKIKVGFTCEFDAINIALKSIREQLTGLPGFNWQPWNQAAFYCLQNNVNLTEGETWIRKSIALNENAGNLNLLGYLLMSQNKNDEALSVFKNNVEKYPNNWNVYDSLGEAYNNFGNINESIKYYKLALDIAPENQKQRIEDILKSIK